MCFICLVLLIVRTILPSLIRKDEIILANLPLIEKSLDSAAATSAHTKHSAPTGKMFVFNPNSVTHAQLIQLGFSDKTASILLKFRSKGFVFKKKEDLKKVYGVGDALYKRLEEYILIDDRNPVAVNKKEIKEQTFATVELNSADSLALLDINGIGPAFAKRILKYRTLLGGFINKEQLLEVYGVTEEMFEKIKTQVTVNSAATKKIDLNNDDFKIINRHPYLSYETTKLILDKRRRGYIDADNLKEILNDPVLYNKIIPYLEF
ncbi:MAG: helix-hairpin-helix domain-containing protein [Bacteroidetes bacterium]|nr:helix-hairpin-helix domain-containing protein [Bacteroidota bacterium]